MKKPFPHIAPKMPNVPVGDYTKNNPGEMGKEYSTMSHSNASHGDLSLQDLQNGHKHMGNPPYMSENVSDVKGAQNIKKKKELRKTNSDPHYNVSDTDSFVLGPNT